MGIFDRFPYSSTHEMNLDFMLGKATEIAEDMQTVTAGMAQVQAGLSAISEKTEQATQAAAQAAQSASSIEGSVTAAEEAAEEAQMHNESAQTWANNAMTYKADCQRSATEAAASATSAAQAATAAAGSEDTVAQYAQAANASAQSAANNNDSAHQYANQASASASNATFHSSNAQTAATNAQTAATNANTSATNASASADRAASLKTDVETLRRMCVAAVDQAATEAVNAANSAAQAASTKTDVETLVESLPEDFTDLNNTVNQLSDDVVDVKSALDGNDVNEQITPTIIPNEWVTSTGTFETANGWSRTDMIDIGSAKSVTADKDVNIALYSSTGDFLNVRATLTVNTPYILNEGVGKIVLYSASAKLNSMTAFYTKPSVIAEMTNEINSLNELINEKTYVYPTSVVSNAYVAASGNLITGATGYAASDYIPLPFNEVQDFEIRGVVYGNASCAIYDKDYTLLLAITESNVSTYGGNTDGGFSVMTIPYIQGMKYARLSARSAYYTDLTDLWAKGNTIAGAFKRITSIEKDLHSMAGNISTTIANSKVLVIGDSISTDTYGNYKKWVTDLKESGFLPSDVVNSSQHATGFVARYNNEANDFITRLKAIQNPSQYDLVIVFGGINDYIQNIPMGSDSGTDYTVSFKPAVNEFFSYLIENFTQARLCVLLPLRTYATWQNTAGEYQQAYGDYIKTVAKSYCLPVLNLTEDSGFCPYITSFRNMWTLVPAGYDASDGVHPNAEYESKYLAPMIKHFLQGLM